MKTMFAIVMVATFAASCFAAGIPGSIPPFELPPEVIRLTTPGEKMPAAFTKPGISFQEMRHITSRTTGNSFEVGNATPNDALVVINGRLVPETVNGRETGLVRVIKHRHVMLFRYQWFEKYGDPMIIGLFHIGPVGRDNKPTLTLGARYVIRFSDLVDNNGNLRYHKWHVMNYDVRPLSRMGLIHTKPKLDGSNPSKLVNLRDPLIAEGPLVVMDKFDVKENRDWVTFEKDPVRDSKGNILGLRIDGLLENKPYAQAGLQVGMIITGRGTVLESDKTVGEVNLTKGDLLMEVLENETSPPRVFRISAESIRKATPVKATNSTVAAAN